MFLKLMLIKVLPLLLLVAFLLGMLAGIYWTEYLIRKELRKKFEQYLEGEKQQLSRGHPYSKALRDQQRKHASEQIKRRDLLRIPK